MLVQEMVRLLVAVAVGLATLFGILVPTAFAGDPTITYIVPIVAGSDDGSESRPMMPDLIFVDGSGMPTHLRQFIEQVVIINF